MKNLVRAWKTSSAPRYVVFCFKWFHVIIRLIGILMCSVFSYIGGI